MERVEKRANTVEGRGMEEPLQEVVMEKDGKFELLSSLDMKAEEEENREIAAAPVQEASSATFPGAQPGSALLRTPQAQDPTSGEPSETEVGDRSSSEAQELAEREEGSEAAATKSSAAQVGSGDESAAKDTINRSAPVTPESISKEPENRANDLLRGALRVSSQVSIMEPERASEGNAATTVGERGVGAGVEATSPAQVLSAGARKEANSRHIRSQSAPAPRIAKRPTAEEEEEERARRNEAAFNAWLARKNEEFLEQQKKKCEKRDTEEEKCRKRGMCEAAFQNWLHQKRKQWEEKKNREVSQRPVTGVPKRDEEKCRQVFKSWMTKKRTQYLEEVKLEQQRGRDMEEKVGKADPSVVDRAYKE